MGPGTVGAVVVAGDEETRVLLRGLLRLHHVRVLGEAEAADEAVDLVRRHAPALLVSDVNLARGSVASLLREARAAHRSIRIVLVTPGDRGFHPPDDGAAPDVLLPRPFRIRQFAEALGASAMPLGDPAGGS